MRFTLATTTTDPAARPHGAAPNPPPLIKAYTGGRALQPGLPLLVFLHGAQHDHSVWIMQSRYLAHHGYNVLALDLPGHGGSEGPPLASIAAMARWVADAVPAGWASAATGAVPPTVVIGHSMGSLIALELGGGVAPAWLAGLVLVATAIPMRVSDTLLAAARDDEAAAFDMINLWSSHGINHYPGTPGPGFSVFNQNRRLMERQKPGVLLNDFSACNAWNDGLARAAALKVPTLYLLAARDQMTPPKAARKAIEATVQATVCTIADAGHNLMAEQPDRTLDALRDWLAQLGDRLRPAGAVA